MYCSIFNIYWNIFVDQRWVGSFSFVKLEECEDPESELSKIFNFSVKESSKYARENGTSPERMLVVVSSANMESDIKLTIQKINENSLYSIKNSFIEVNQSNEKKGRPSLYGAPFKVDITVLPAKGTIFEPNKHIGRGQKKVQRDVRHNIDLDAIYDCGNIEDNYCLFRAIELLRRKEQMAHQRFSDYRRNNQRQTLDILQLLGELNIPIGLDGYDVETYAPLLQAYYDLMFPGKFAIFFFSDVGQYKPFFKTRGCDFEIPLCIYYANGHFTAIRRISTFFSIRKYCFHCEKPYSRDAEHAMNCTARCMMCCVVGNGKCVEVDGYEKYCDNCYKTFKNTRCYMAHQKNGSCNESKQCNKCGVIYRYKGGKVKHVCGAKYCR